MMFIPLVLFFIAFAGADPGVQENVEFPDDLASTSQEELDRELRTILASADRNHKSKVELDPNAKNSAALQDVDGVADVSPDESVDLSPSDADVQTADGVVALTSSLNQEPDNGESVFNQEEAIASFPAAFDQVDYGLSSQIASTSAGADQDKVKQACFALLASVALDLKSIVDLQIDPSAAENNYTTSPTNWRNRAAASVALQNVDGLADVSQDIGDDDVPFADAARDIGDGQRPTFDVACWEWLKKAVFCLTSAVIVSIDPEVARQDWLERAGACIVASLACLIKWMEEGCPTRELGEEEERQQQQESAHYYELLHIVASIQSTAI